MPIVFEYTIHNTKFDYYYYLENNFLKIFSIFTFKIIHSFNLLIRCENPYLIEYSSVSRNIIYNMQRLKFKL
jgi:hypothetical protein